MPRVPFIRLDPFAFADSDTDEARAFTTYMVYWTALAGIIRAEYGTDGLGLAPALEARRAFRSLSGSMFRGDEDVVRSLLLNGWNSELALYLVDEGDDRLMAQNQWNNVYAYYATSKAALAWLVVRDGQAPSRHRPMLRAMAAQAHGSSLFPAPWNLTCSAVAPPDYGGFPTVPKEVSNLTLSGDPHDMTAKMLRTTRRKRVEELVAEARGGRCRARNGEARRQDAALESTTVFDFAWRSRTRANYGDPSMFYVGTLDLQRCRVYVRAVRLFTSATMLLFEALVAQRAREVVIDAAVHFISRDRAGVTTFTLEPRMRALGLL